MQHIILQQNNMLHSCAIAISAFFRDRFIKLLADQNRSQCWDLQICHWTTTAFALGYQDQMMARRVQKPPSVLLHMSCGRIVSCPHFIKCGCTFQIEIVKLYKFQTRSLSERAFVNSNMDLPRTAWSQHIMSTLHQMW